MRSYICLFFICFFIVGCSDAKVVDNSGTHSVDYSYAYFTFNEKFFEAKLSFAKLNDHTNPDTVPKIKLFLEILNLDFETIYKKEIGEYISGDPYLIPPNDFAFIDNVLMVCKTWYGGSGDYIIISEDNGTLSLFEGPADIAFELMETSKIMTVNMSDILKN